MECNSCFKIVFVPLSEDQVDKIELAARFCTPLTIILSKKQLSAASEEVSNNKAALPLTTLQLRSMQQALASQSDFKLTLNLHQLRDFMKINEDIDIDIKSANLFYQKHRRIFKR